MLTLRGSLHSFHHSLIRSSYMSFIYSLRHPLHLRVLEPTVALLPTYQGFIVQLVEQRTGIAEVMGSNPVEALRPFKAIKTQLLNTTKIIPHVPFIYHYPEFIYVFHVFILSYAITIGRFLPKLQR